MRNLSYATTKGHVSNKLPMSIEYQNTIDAISIDKTGLVELTISDHLEWNSEHLFLLQEKINCYLAFLESGEVFETYPESKNKDFKINLVCKYEPTEVATHFISQCTSTISQAGFQFGYEIFV